MLVQMQSNDTQLPSYNLQDAYLPERWNYPTIIKCILVSQQISFCWNRPLLMWTMSMTLSLRSSPGGVFLCGVSFVAVTSLCILVSTSTTEGEHLGKFVLK